MTATRQTVLPPMLSAGLLALDTRGFVLFGPHGASAGLDLGPYLVLRELMRRPGVVVSTSALIEAMWPDVDQEPRDTEHAVRQRVVRARQAVRSVGVPGTALRLIRGAGYSVAAAPAVVLVVTPLQATAIRELVATHPNRAAAAVAMEAMAT